LDLRNLYPIVPGQQFLSSDRVPGSVHLLADRIVLLRRLRSSDRVRTDPGRGAPRPRFLLQIRRRQPTAAAYPGHPAAALAKWLRARPLAPVMLEVAEAARALALVRLEGLGLELQSAARRASSRTP